MEQQQISYFAHEGMMTRLERTIKRLWIALIVLIILMFATNAAWLWAWMQYEYVNVDEQIDVSADNGVANYIGNDGDINNGKDTSQTADEDSEEAQWQKPGD